jgi:hypothetical protein
MKDNQKKHKKPNNQDQPTLEELTKSLSVVMLCRSTCSLCNASKEDAKNAHIDSYIVIKDIDTEDGISFLNKLQKLPEGTVSLPIYTSTVTKKNHFGYEPIETIIKSLK